LRLIVLFVDVQRDEHGVEPICSALQDTAANRCVDLLRRQVAGRCLRELP
jgi:hypothetical protein